MSDASHRPNVIFIMTDALRATSLGLYGNPDVRTPHSERIAQEGMTFDRTYYPNPSCVPSRCALARRPQKLRSRCGGHRGAPDGRHPADRNDRRFSHVEPGAAVGIVAVGRSERQRAALHAQARCVRPLGRVVPDDRERQGDRSEAAQGDEVRVRPHLVFRGLRGHTKLSRSPPSSLDGGGPIVSCTPRRGSARGST